MTTPRRQHYVWRHYLDAWAHEKLVWCAMDGRRFRVSTNNVAHQRDFYGLEELSSQDVVTIEALIRRMGPTVQGVARRWLREFQFLHQLRRASIARGQHTLEREQQIQEQLNLQEEKLHGHIEQMAIPLLNALRRGDAGVLNDPGGFADLALFLSFQHMRTPRVRDRVFGETSDTLPPSFNIDAAWGVLRTIFATNQSIGIFRRRANAQMVFLEAVEGCEFVAGDQPIINLSAVGLPPHTPPTGLEWYYPLSPERALLLTVDGEFPGSSSRRVTFTEVARLNETIAAMSGGTVYAKCEAALPG